MYPQFPPFVITISNLSLYKLFLDLDDSLRGTEMVMVRTKNVI